MRKDMKHVVIDRPRSGGARKAAKGSKKRLQRNPDEAPKKEGMKQPWSGDRKSLSDHIGPLRRFLESKVGKKWDDVYSELCENLDKRSVTGRHVFTHVNVATDTFIGPDGKVWAYIRGKESEMEEPPGSLYYSLYVHPKTGILCQSPHRKWWRTETTTNPDALPIKKIRNKFRQFRKKNGSWFELELIEVPVKLQSIGRYGSIKALLTPKLENYYDPWHRGYVISFGKLTTLGEEKRSYFIEPNPTYYNLDKPAYFCKSFHQLSKKEIKKHGLNTH